MPEALAEWMPLVLMVAFAGAVVLAFVAQGRANRTQFDVESASGGCAACGSTVLRRVTGPGSTVGYECVLCGYEGGDAVAARQALAGLQALRKLPLAKQWEQVLDIAASWRRARKEAEGLEPLVARGRDRSPNVWQDAEEKRVYEERSLRLEALEAEIDARAKELLGAVGVVAPDLDVDPSRGADEGLGALVARARADLLAQKLPYARVSRMVGVLERRHVGAFVAAWLDSDVPHDEALFQAALTFAEHQGRVVDALAADVAPTVRRAAARAVLDRGPTSAMAAAAEAVVAVDGDAGLALVLARHERAVAADEDAVFAALAPWADADAARRAKAAGAVSLSTQPAAGALSPTRDRGGLSRTRER